MSTYETLPPSLVAEAIAERGSGWGQVSEGFIQRLAGEMNAAGLPLNSHSIAYESFRVIKSGPGTLFGFSVYNSKISAQFVQLFDMEGVSQLATGAVPVFVMSVATVADREVSWVIPGRFFARGIVIANSSTGPTYTAGSADCWFDAQYI